MTTQPRMVESAPRRLERVRLATTNRTIKRGAPALAEQPIHVLCIPTRAVTAVHQPPSTPTLATSPSSVVIRHPSSACNKGSRSTAERTSKSLHCFCNSPGLLTIHDNSRERLALTPAAFERAASRSPAPERSPRLSPLHSDVPLRSRMLPHHPPTLECTQVIPVLDRAITVAPKLLPALCYRSRT